MDKSGEDNHFTKGAERTMDNYRGTEEIKVVGIDLAKNVFHLHGVDASGRVVLRKKLSRSKLIALMANLPPCLVGMEACGGAHDWARKFQAMGHEVRLMSPQFVKPYVKSNKNDMVDAEAVCEAVQRPSMRFVPIKGIEQQDIQSLHRARSMAVGHRTAQVNQIRGLLLEYGLPVTATALVAAVADAKVFKSGREMSAWLGLVPRQYSTGGKPKLLGISKRGDTYLRKLLIHGARAALRFADKKQDRRSRWVVEVEGRRGRNIAAVALANKTVRTAWVLLSKSEEYKTTTAV